VRIREFGDKKNEIVILIHGLNIPWQMWNEEINIFSEKFHVIVPVLSGHDIEQGDPFISIDEEAKQIKEFVLTNYGNSVYMIIGTSMGAAIAFSVVADSKLHSDFLVFDSGVFVSSNPLIMNINNRMQLSYKNKTKSRDKKTLEQLVIAYGEKLAPFYVEMADVMTDDNLLAASNAIGKFSLSKQLQLPNTNIIAFHGTVFMEIMAKKAAKYLKKHFPKAYIKAFQGNQHAQLSVNQPTLFVEEIEKAIQHFS